MKFSATLIEQARHLWRWLRSRDAVTFLLFVLFATILWYGHALGSVRNGILHVRVTYTHLPDDIALETPLPSALEVEVRDAGSRLRTYRHNPPVLEFSLAGQLQGEEGDIRISAESIRRSLSDLLQGTSKLQRVTPEQITAHYYRQAEKTVPVTMDCEAQPAPQQQLAAPVRVTPATVRIFGSKAVLDTIHTLRTEPVLLTAVADTVRIPAALLVPAAVRAEVTHVQIESVAERFPEKRLRVPVTATDVPEGEQLHLFPNEVTAIARVGLSHYSELKETDFRVTCAYPAPGDSTLQARVTCTNPNATHIRIEPNLLEFLIQQ